MTTPDRPADPGARLKKLNSTAVRLKFDLHDLAEDLPVGWERILEVAGQAYDAYAELARLKGELAEEGPG